jgi:hypothetical protein
MADIGIGFLPQDEQGYRQQQGAFSGEGITPLQAAVKFLSLRLPRFAGSGSIVAQPLLPGGPGGRPNPEDLPGLLRRLGGLGRGPGFEPMPAGGPAPRAPGPIWTPGSRHGGPGPGPGVPEPPPQVPWRVPRMPRMPYDQNEAPLNPADLLAHYQRTMGGGFPSY